MNCNEMWNIVCQYNKSSTSVKYLNNSFNTAVLGIIKHVDSH